MRISTTFFGGIPSQSEVNPRISVKRKHKSREVVPLLFLPSLSLTFSACCSVENETYGMIPLISPTISPISSDKSLISSFVLIVSENLSAAEAFFAEPLKIFSIEREVFLTFLRRNSSGLKIKSASRIETITERYRKIEIKVRTKTLVRKYCRINTCCL